MNNLILDERTKTIEILNENGIIYKDSTYNAVKKAILNKYNINIDYFVESFGVTNQPDKTAYAVIILKESLKEDELKKFKDNFLNFFNYEDGILLLSFSINLNDLALAILL